MPGSHLDGLLSVEIRQSGSRLQLVGGAAGGALDFASGLTLTQNSDGSVSIAVTPAFSGTQVSLGSATTPRYTLAPQAKKATTTNGTIDLFDSAVSVAASSSVKIRATIQATIQTAAQIAWLDTVAVARYSRLATGSAALVWSKAVADESSASSPTFAGSNAATTVTGAADNGSGKIRLAVASSAALTSGNTVTVASVGGTTEANGQWIVDVIDPTHVDLRGSTFTHAWTSGGTLTPNGAIGLSLVANAVQITATGIKAAAWMQSETVSAGDIRSNVHGAFFCSQGGTTSGVGTGPNGTGTGITDGTAKWDYIGTGTDVPISWSAVLETFTA